MKIKKFLAYLMAAILLPMAASCGSDDKEEGYAGANKVYLSADNPTLVEGSDTQLTVTVSLTKTLAQDITLTFQVADDADEVLKLEDNPVTIPAGSREGSFKVMSNTKDVLTENTSFTFQLASSTNNEVTLDESQILRVTVSPSLKVPELTDAQKALLEGYKTKYNLDLTPWIGIVPCTGSVHVPSIDTSKDFATERTETISGNTVITLSEYATADQPILKMTANPLGLTNFMFWLLRKETIENDEYWFVPDASPSYAKVMELLDWSREKPGTFSMTLDSLIVNTQTHEISFLKYDDYNGIDKIPFAYNYSPWEKQKALIAAGNADAAALNEEGATANPDFYLQYGNMTENDLEAGYFVEPKASIDPAKKTMTFRFSTSSATLCTSYCEVNVTYQIQ